MILNIIFSKLNLTNKYTIRNSNSKKQSTSTRKPMLEKGKTWNLKKKKKTYSKQVFTKE